MFIVMTLYAVFSRDSDVDSYGANIHTEYPWVHRATCVSESAAISWIEHNRGPWSEYSIKPFEAEGLVPKE